VKYRRWCHKGECIMRNKVTNYAVGNVSSALEGVRAGVSGLIVMMVLSPLELYNSPDKWARSAGAFGCLLGLCLSPFYLLCIYWMHFYTLLIVF